MVAVARPLRAALCARLTKADAVWRRAGVESVPVREANTRAIVEALAEALLAEVM